METPPETRAGVADVDCTGAQAVVTGSTSGIGRAAAVALGRLGADVVVHGRDRDAGAAVVAELETLGADATFVPADFADRSAVREFATTVRSETGGVDVLINNAGGFFRDARTTDLGVERTFHINHLSPFLLTAELLDHLREGARVVTTASAAHYSTELDIDRTTRLDGYSGFWAYRHSKLANVLFATELARRLDTTDRAVVSNSLHPGAVPGTGFSRFLPGPLPELVKLFDSVPGTTSVADGAAALLFLGVSPRTAEISGRYLSGQDPETPSDAAQDRSAARRLWKRSADLLGIPEPLSGDDGANTGPT